MMKPVPSREELKAQLDALDAEILQNAGVEFEINAKAFGEPAAWRQRLENLIERLQPVRESVRALLGGADIEDVKRERDALALELKVANDEIERVNGWLRQIVDTLRPDPISRDQRRLDAIAEQNARSATGDLPKKK